ncbi:hypothetical protein [Hafnia phage Pocis76]|uniref:Uncharacterized protein n=1 Tax=Hafnia phage Pocis76 TaxID=2831174 RepID=A0A8E7KY27_9CAUD|nr:hypothetical protein [Hafnia phage Pocis76]
MVSINLSEKQARELMKMMMWGADEVNDETACEIIAQIENKLLPRPSEQAELAAWRGEKRIKGG